MDIESFRTHAHRLVDWMADYYGRVENFPVKAQVEPGEVLASLELEPPAQGESMERIFADFEEILLPGMTHWQHPSFFAYFPANSSPPSVLAEMLTATLGAQCMSWQTSPAATELETRVLEWLRIMIGLPKAFVGCIQDTASTATLAAIISARERKTEYRSNAEGLGGAGSFTLYCSRETHSSIEKGAKIAGIGRSNVRLVDVGPDRGLVPDSLEKWIREDLAAGHTPFCVIATLGTTGTSAFDPLGPIGEICRAYDLWLHVDAAWAGSALILPECRWMIEGIESADSFVFNPHKWMFTNFDCSAYFVRDVDSLLQTFEILPEYLKTKEADQVVNYRDWGIPLGRRFRALKLWFVIREHGVEGLQLALRRHIVLAGNIAEQISADQDFELLEQPRLALFCFRFRPPAVAGTADRAGLAALNQELLETLNDTGRVYFTHTRVDGEYFIRWQIGQTATDARHVERAWELIRETSAELCPLDP